VGSRHEYYPLSIFQSMDGEYAIGFCAEKPTWAFRTTASTAKAGQTHPAISRLTRLASGLLFQGITARPSAPASPICQVLIFSGATGRVVRAQSVKIVVAAMLCRNLIVIGLSPGVDRLLLLLDIGTLPPNEPCRLLDQCFQTLRLGRVATEIKAEQVERRFDVLNIDASRIGFRSAQIFDDLRSHQPNKEPEDREHHQELYQREPVNMACRKDTSISGFGAATRTHAGNHTEMGAHRLESPPSASHEHRKAGQNRDGRKPPNGRRWRTTHNGMDRLLPHLS
jgi:hypothetical protein